MTFTPSYAQIDSPDPISPQDLATKNYVDTRPDIRPRYSCRVVRNAALTLPGANVAQQIFWDSKTWDPDICYSLASGMYTCPVAGLYLFRASTSISMTGAGTLNCVLVKTGANAAVVGSYTALAQAFAVMNVSVENCVVGDVLGVNHQCSIASVTMRAPAPTEAFMEVVYLGPNL